MDIAKLFKETPNQGITAREYIENLWTACKDEDHFFTYLMQSMHFLAYDIPVIPEILMSFDPSLESMSRLANPQMGEPYNAFMSAVTDESVGVCYGIRTDKDGTLRTSWFNVVARGEKIYAVNAGLQHEDAETATMYTGIRIPTGFITERWTKVKTGWNLLEVYIKQYEDVLPFVTSKQAEEMLIQDRRRMIEDNLAAMDAMGEFLLGIPPVQREALITSMRGMEV